MRTANRDLMKEWNKKLVLNLIREKELISQVEIFKKSGISAGTVANITRELRSQGFIENIGRGESNGGRKPILFRFNPRARYVISAAFFAMETRVAILDLGGNILQKAAYPTRPDRGKEYVFDEFRQRVESLLLQLSIPKEKVIALGASFEGAVNADTGSLRFSAHFRWRDTPVKRILEESLGLMTFVENESRAMAIAECWFGVGKKINNMVLVTIESGTGAAIIFNGQIYRGANQMEGEIGHILTVPNGPLCRCGKRGCLEAVASGSAIFRKAVESVPKGVKTIIPKGINHLPERKVIKIIFQSADEGDKLSRQILQSASRYLGQALANVVNYADPQMIVLTGYVVEEDPGILLRGIKKEFQKAVLGRGMREVKIVKGELGEDAVLIGGATLVYQDMFSLPREEESCLKF